MALDCTTKNQEDVLAAVIGERSYQDHKWGAISERPHEVGAYMTLMRKLLADAEAAWASSRGDHDALDELRKVVAVGVACFEQHGVPSRMRKEPKMNHDGYREALAAHSAKAQPPAASVTDVKDARTPDSIDVIFEVWQDDEMVASCSGPEPQALAEARHYALEYAYDGLVSVFRVSRVRINTKIAKESGR